MLSAPHTRAAVTARQLAVLQRAGLIDLRRPVSLLRQSFSVRRLGPIAGGLRESARRTPDRTYVPPVQTLQVRYAKRGRMRFASPSMGPPSSRARARSSPSAPRPRVVGGRR